MSGTNHHDTEDGVGSRQPNGAMAVSSAPAVDPAGASSSEWRRFSFLRSWLWLELPVVAVLFAAVILFVAVVLSTESAGGLLSMLFGQVDPHGEMNVSTWVNAGLWQIAGLLAGYYTLRANEHRKSWAAICALCFYFSLDETVRLHEHLNLLFADFGQRLPVATFAWVVPGVLFTLLVAGLLLRMVLSLPRRSRNGFLAGGAVFVLGSLGLETVEGFIYYGQEVNDVFIALGIVEEALEMTGVALAIAAMLHLLEWRRMDEAMAYRVNVRREAGAPARS